MEEPINTEEALERLSKLERAVEANFTMLSALNSVMVRVLKLMRDSSAQAIEQNMEQITEKLKKYVVYGEEENEKSGEQIIAEMEAERADNEQHHHH